MAGLTRERLSQSPKSVQNIASARAAWEIRDLLTVLSRHGDEKLLHWRIACMLREELLHTRGELRLYSVLHLRLLKHPCAFSAAQPQQALSQASQQPQLQVLQQPQAVSRSLQML